MLYGNAHTRAPVAHPMHHRPLLPSTHNPMSHPEPLLAETLCGNVHSERAPWAIPPDRHTPYAAPRRTPSITYTQFGNNRALGPNTPHTAPTIAAGHHNPTQLPQHPPGAAGAVKLQLPYPTAAASLQVPPAVAQFLPPHYATTALPHALHPKAALRTELLHWECAHTTLPDDAAPVPLWPTNQPNGCCYDLHGEIRPPPVSTV